MVKPRHVTFAESVSSEQRIEENKNAYNVLEQKKKEIINDVREKAWTPHIKTIKNMDQMNVTLDHLKEPAWGKVPDKQNSFVQGLVKPHVDSFSWFVDRGIDRLTENLYIDFDLKSVGSERPRNVQIFFKEIRVNKPLVNNVKKYPYQCRIESTCYRGELIAKIGWKISGVEQESIEKCIGLLPIMVKSSKCNLLNLGPAELIQRGEEEQEAGGYFIVNGYEKVMRLLLVQRRNYPISIKRGGWSKKGPFFSEYGLSTRCVPPDNSFVSTNVLHMLENGRMRISFTWRKEDFYIPVMLVIVALSSKSMAEHLLDIMRCEGEDSNDASMGNFMSYCIRDMMAEVINNSVNTSEDALALVGKNFRCTLDLPESYSDVKVGEYLLRKVVCIHLPKFEDKASYLKYKMRKLFYFYKGKCCEESLDNPMFQEALLPGHAFMMIVNDCLQQHLYFVKEEALKLIKNGEGLNIETVKKALSKVHDVTGTLEKCLSVGVYNSRHNLGPLGWPGLTVSADRLNYVRFISHFRAIHRGSFYSKMRTTTPRKLRQECYGFLCPVHTPDGAPCGLLNHMTFSCEVVVSCNLENYKNVLKVLNPTYFVMRDFVLSRDLRNYLPVLMDGNHVGWVDEAKISQVCDLLRNKKVKGEDLVPRNMEICHVPRMNGSVLPGLYLFAAAGRLIRPVENVTLEMPEYLGVFEQVYLTLSYDEKDCLTNGIMHKELSRFSMLSEVACFTPFANFNQSCRNLFQCQMSKQTVGVPYLTERYRTDNKTYRLVHAQSPLVRSVTYDMLNIDDHPLGVNVVVAVMSYTGYDMEDAIVINKSSHDRGLFSTLIYKIQQLDLREKKMKGYEFARNDDDPSLKGKLDKMGLPITGTVVNPNDPLFCYREASTKQYQVERYHGSERATIDRVFYCAKIKNQVVFVKVKLRIYRKPVIGDKFCNRHGQKGILSSIWPHNEMPYTSNGIVPDILFNPHGFPSRMTISMMLELLAGKVGSLYGTCFDASPFLYDEENNPMQFFGDALEKAGFNRYGKDIMYSGRTGEPLQCYIFTGMIYYQRLRHMVDDKWQVRCFGQVDEKTQQPVGGRKRGGGVRFGEMERDGLIAHGTASLIQDRLVNCSDGVQIPICRDCGNIHSVSFDYAGEESFKCSICQKENVAAVFAPHVLRYLTQHLPDINFEFITTDQ